MHECSPSIQENMSICQEASEYMLAFNELIIDNDN